jgi:hypothetical protein
MWRRRRSRAEPTRSGVSDADAYRITAAAMYWAKLGRWDEVSEVCAPLSEWERDSVMMACDPVILRCVRPDPRYLLKLAGTGGGQR